MFNKRTETYVSSERRVFNESAAIGDQFMKEEIQKFFPNAEVSGYDTGWPVDLSQLVYKGEEISEYDGTEEAVIEAAKDAEYLIIDIAPVSKKILDALSNLNAIAVTRGGAVNINLKEASQKNAGLSKKSKS